MLQVHGMGLHGRNIHGMRTGSACMYRDMAQVCVCIGRCFSVNGQSLWHTNQDCTQPRPHKVAQQAVSPPTPAVGTPATRGCPWETAPSRGTSPSRCTTPAAAHCALTGSSPCEEGVGGCVRCWSGRVRMVGCMYEYRPCVRQQRQAWGARGKCTTQ